MRSGACFAGPLKRKKIPPNSHNSIRLRTGAGRPCQLESEARDPLLDPLFFAVLLLVRYVYGKITVSSKGQIAIPKAVRDALNLGEGSKLTLEVRGTEIILSKESPWKKLQGAAAGTDLLKTFAKFKKQERKREDPRP